MSYCHHNGNFLFPIPFQLHECNQALHDAASHALTRKTTLQYIQQLQVPGVLILESWATSRGPRPTTKILTTDVKTTKRMFAPSLLLGGTRHSAVIYITAIFKGACGEQRIAFRNNNFNEILFTHIILSAHCPTLSRGSSSIEHCQRLETKRKCSPNLRRRAISGSLIVPV